MAAGYLIQILLLSCLAQRYDSYTYKMEGGEVFCFYQELEGTGASLPQEATRYMMFSYNVLSAGSSNKLGLLISVDHQGTK